MSLTLTSPAFKNNGRIPARYTCDGANVSPPLEWAGIPSNTHSFVLILDDPDAPDPMAPTQTWVHWVLVNLPPTVSQLPEALRGGDLPLGTIEGTNDWKQVGYGGPCPPIGKHRYFHKLYALDCVLEGLRAPTKAQVEAAMKGHVLAAAELVGTYQAIRR
jgi:Raf kinase inhibitor-like YbhB/YbcL family protein